MSKILSDYQTKLDQVLQDLDEELETTPKAAYLQEAIGTHSQNKPYILAVSITGNATFLYDLPVDWEEGFSEIKSIEFPAGTQVPTILDTTRYMIYQGPTGKKIRFLQDTPTALQAFILTYTKRHVVATGLEVPPSPTTIPDADFDAVCNLAGALCCYALGRKLTEESGGASMAVRDQTWRSVLRYSEKGKELMDLYLSQIGLISITAINSTAVADTDAENARKDAELVLKQNADLRAAANEPRLDAENTRQDSTIALLVNKDTRETTAAASQETRLAAEEIRKDAQETRLDAAEIRQAAELTIKQAQEARAAIMGVSLSIPFMHMMTLAQIIDGTGDFTYPVPDGWQPFYSYIREILYPMEDQAPATIDPNTYFVFLGADGMPYLRFAALTPELGKTFQITYTINNKALRVFHQVEP